MICTMCEDSGLVSAVHTEKGGSYFFRCLCESGQRRKENLPVWRNPSRGFEQQKIVIDKIEDEVIF